MSCTSLLPPYIFPKQANPMVTMPHQEKKQNHFLLVTFPAQGHINPALEFALRVVRYGVHVTFLTTMTGHRRILNSSNSYPDGLNFFQFSDGYDDGCKPTDDASYYLLEFRRRGTEALSILIERFAIEGRPVTCLIYTVCLPWAAQVAHRYQVCSASLWIQPATVFNLFYYYFNGYRDLIVDNINDPSYTVKLPGLPLFKAGDLPPYFLPTNTDKDVFRLFEEQFEFLSQETKPLPILVNTFDELEAEALNVVPKVKLLGIGPLIPYNIMNNCDDNSKEYIEWLDSKEKSSVVYVSFGSIMVLTIKQMEELARGLVDSGRPFLWVIRSGEEKEEKYKEIIGEVEEQKGMVVKWCSQVEVLKHPSIGCFVTHCGWNSSIETIAAGVTVVAFPQWADQKTNGKLMEDVWKIGVRLRTNEEDKIVNSEEIVRCLNEVMEGEKGEELRQNAMKLMDLSREAVKEGGSSDRNLARFVEAIGQICF